MRKQSLLIMTAVVGALCFAAPGQADIINTDIPSIQDTSSVLWDTFQTASDTVIVEGVITGADTKATGFGFYIELPKT